MHASTDNSLLSLNQNGVYFIETGNYEEAVRTFGQALAATKKVMNTNPPSNKNAMVYDDAMDHDSAMSMDATYPLIYHFYTDSKQQSANANRNSLVFRNPLAIPAENAQCNNDQFAFIVLYNLALSHHLDAIASGKSVEKFMKAQQLWELVYKIHWKDSLCLDTIHTCAILNNLGQVHKTLGNHHKMRLCFESLLSAMVCLTDCGRGHCLGNNESFFRNVSQFILRDSKAAPAA